MRLIIILVMLFTVSLLSKEKSEFPFISLNTTKADIFVKQNPAFNGDGVVDAEDMALLLGNWGSSVRPTGWISGWDGFVDADELADLLGNWGAGIGGGASIQIAVSEPTSLTLLAIFAVSFSKRGGAMVLCRFYRKHRS